MRTSLVIFLISVAVTGAFILDLCDLIYECGCRSWWAGAASQCNIHTPGVRHCPWCSIGEAGFATVAALIVVPQAILSFRPRQWNWLGRLTASLLAFPLMGLLIALVLGSSFGYW